MAEPRRRAEPVHLVDRALHAQGLLASLTEDALHQGRYWEFLPDHLVDVRIARQEGAIGMKHGNGRTHSDGDGGEEFLVIGGVDAPRHHAEKDAVFSIQSMGDDGVQVAVEMAEDRFGQNRFRLRVGSEGPEVGPVGDI